MLPRQKGLKHSLTHRKQIGSGSCIYLPNSLGYKKEDIAQSDMSDSVVIANINKV